MGTPKGRALRSNSNPCTSASPITLREISQLIRSAKDEMLSSFKAEFKIVNDSLATLASRIENVEFKLNHVSQTLMNQERRLERCDEEIKALKETTRGLDPEATAREIEMRFAKRNNLIVSGIPEPTQGSLEQRREVDLEKVKALLSELDVRDPRLEGVFRIGQSLRRERLICIKVQDFALKQDILRKAKSLRNSNEFKQCFINPDLTPSQRAKDKELRDTLKRKREEGLDMIIRGGKLILREELKPRNFH